MCKTAEFCFEQVKGQKTCRRQKRERDDKTDTFIHLDILKVTNKK